MSAEVLGCCQALIELKIFLRAPNNIYFDLKKVSAEAIALYTSPKSGEITFNLSRFWDTCWLIRRTYKIPSSRAPVGAKNTLPPLPSISMQIPALGSQWHSSAQFSFPPQSWHLRAVWFLPHCTSRRESQQKKIIPKIFSSVWILLFLKSTWQIYGYSLEASCDVQKQALEDWVRTWVASLIAVLSLSFAPLNDDLWQFIKLPNFDPSDHRQVKLFPWFGSFPLDKMFIEISFPVQIPPVQIGKLLEISVP